MAYRLNSRQSILDELPADVRSLLETSQSPTALATALNTSSDLRQSAIGRLLDNMPASTEGGNEGNDVQHECRACIDRMIEALIYSEARSSIEEMEAKQQALFVTLYQRLGSNEHGTVPAPSPLSSYFESIASKEKPPPQMFSSTIEWAPKSEPVKDRVRRRSSFAFKSEVADLMASLAKCQLETIRAERSEILATGGSVPAPIQSSALIRDQKSLRPFKF